MYPDIQLVYADGTKSRLVPSNTADFHALTKSTEWNSLVYADLWNMASAKHITSSDHTSSTALAHPKPRSSKLSGYVLSATYLPRRQELLLQLRLGSKYRRLRVINPPATPVNDEARQRLVFNESQSSDIEKVLIKLIRGYLPTSFLEGFAALRMSICRMGFPNSPKTIFTSNRHIFDDVFNAWAADATENGSRLILGQHGGHYGISRFPSYAERHEISVSDTYLTWGSSSCQNATPAFILTILGKRRPLSKGSKLVLITDHLWSQKRSQFIDIDQTSNYTKHINDVVNSLPSGICGRLIIRTHHGQDETGRPIVDESRVNELGITVDDGSTAYSRLLKKSRIVVVAHNGTTFLETLSLGVPTLITWTSNWVEIRDEAKPIFAKLAEVGIFHEDPVSLAKHVSAIWDNVDAWWESKEVMEARELFCSQYARSVPHPRKFLREIIMGKSTMELQGDL